jgi:hypothetical protein
MPQSSNSTSSKTTNVVAGLLSSTLTRRSVIPAMISAFCAAVAPWLPEPGGGLGEPVGVPAVQDDIAALGQEGPGDVQADPAGRTGDDGSGLGVGHGRCLHSAVGVDTRTAGAANS